MCYEQGKKDTDGIKATLLIERDKKARKQTYEEVLKEVELELGNIYTYAGVDYPAFCGKMVELKDRHCSLDRIKEKLEQKLQELSK